jgi:AAA ATPase domain
VGAPPLRLAVRVLLERSEELRALSAALDEARSGAITTVWVGGEAGSGKSTLTAHFTATAPCRVLRSGCDGATTAAPLGPLIDIAPALAVDVPGDAGEPVDRIRLFAATRAALVAEPTVWLVEDLYWADAPTLDLIRYLARRGDAGPSCCCSPSGTTRSASAIPCGYCWASSRPCAASGGSACHR